MKMLKFAGLVLFAAVFLIVLSKSGLVFALSPADPVDLGAADSFAVLGATTVTNTGSTVLNGDLGLYDGTSITGFFGTPPSTGPGVVSAGYAVHLTDATSSLAQTAATSAYGSMTSQSAGCINLSSQNLGGKTLTPGVYCFTSAAQLTGTLTLNAQGNSNAVWIFQVGSSLTVADGASIADGAKVVIINPGTGTPGCNVYWQVDSAATIGTYATFIGTIIADKEAVTLKTGAIMYGRAISRISAVTLDTNTITVLTCAAPVNGACGTAAQTYPYTATSFGADTLCSAGTPSISPAFPTPGNSATWICAGINDGSSSNCTVAVSSAPSTPINGGGMPAPITPKIGITKTVSPLALTTGSGTVVYNYTVWNVGRQRALADVTVIDDKCGPVSYLSGDLNKNFKIESDESWVYTCTTNLTETTTNTAIATGYSDDPYHQMTKATATATVIVSLPSSTPDTTTPTASSPTPSPVIVPGLPNAGLPPQNNPWDIITFYEMLAFAKGLM